ncbi:hypothetical protein BAE44_0022579 [Dichanthelium oligosanthes]|uniref:Reverse transcriptase zinc-binding domain-containing protein n=1 Tax=Dichanthelium oligosanthes TaxID=888268 RepID=A0A1E5UU55_9POAL|nr:hypothetical protein BAE44_0022579 [Dichanthelium oligosanthes]
MSDHRGMGSALQPFTSKAFYAWHMAEQPPDAFAVNLWRNAATPRCKHFVWLVHRERLPSAAVLQHRNITESAICSLWGAHEDQHHILLQCPGARSVWRAIGWPCAPYLLSFRELWMLPALTGLDMPIRSAIITAVLWNIWKARNAFVFNQEYIPTKTMVRNAAADLDLWTLRTRSPIHSFRTSLADHAYGSAYAL